MNFKIIKMSESDKKIGLSLRGAKDEQEKSRLQDYQRRASAVTQDMEQAIQKGKDDSRKS